MANSLPNFLLTDFRNFLRKYLKNVTDWYDPSKLEFVKSGDRYVIAPTLSYTYNSECLIPFHENSSKKIIWMGVSIEFPSSIKAAEPNEISLRFFSGELDNFSMIFRAEFSRVNTNHSQPHWHFHFIEEQKIAETFSEYEKKSTESFDTLSSKFQEIHFQMGWNIKENCMPELTRSDILTWMKQTVENIKNELVIIYS